MENQEAKYFFVKDTYMDEYITSVGSRVPRCYRTEGGAERRAKAENKKFLYRLNNIPFDCVAPSQESYMDGSKIRFVAEPYFPEEVMVG